MTKLVRFTKQSFSTELSLFLEIDKSRNSCKLPNDAGMACSRFPSSDSLNNLLSRPNLSGKA